MRIWLLIAWVGLLLTSSTGCLATVTAAPAWSGRAQATLHGVDRSGSRTEMPWYGALLPRWLVRHAAPDHGELDLHRGNRHFAIYDGWPSVVNDVAGNIDAAAAIFA